MINNNYTKEEVLSGFKQLLVQSEYNNLLYMIKDDGVRQILVDKETGVNYLCWKSGYGAGITPLLDSEGKVIVTKSNSSLQN